MAASRGIQGARRYHRQIAALDAEATEILGMLGQLDEGGSQVDYVTLLKRNTISAANERGGKGIQNLRWVKSRRAAH